MLIVLIKYLLGAKNKQTFKNSMSIILKRDLFIIHVQVRSGY